MTNNIYSSFPPHRQSEILANRVRDEILYYNKEGKRGAELSQKISKGFLAAHRVGAFAWSAGCIFYKRVLPFKVSLCVGSIVFVSQILGEMFGLARKEIEEGDKANRRYLDLKGVKENRYREVREKVDEMNLAPVDLRFKSHIRNQAKLLQKRSGSLPQFIKTLDKYDIAQTPCEAYSLAHSLGDRDVQKRSLQMFAQKKLGFYKEKVTVERVKAKIDRWLKMLRMTAEEAVEKYSAKGLFPGFADLLMLPRDGDVKGEMEFEKQFAAQQKACDVLCCLRLKQCVEAQKAEIDSSLQALSMSAAEAAKKYEAQGLVADFADPLKGEEDQEALREKFWQQRKAVALLSSRERRRIEILQKTPFEEFQEACTKLRKNAIDAGLKYLNLQNDGFFTLEEVERKIRLKDPTKPLLEREITAWEREGKKYHEEGSFAQNFKCLQAKHQDIQTAMALWKRKSDHFFYSSPIPFPKTKDKLLHSLYEEMKKTDKEWIRLEFISNLITTLVPALFMMIATFVTSPLLSSLLLGSVFVLVGVGTPHYTRKIKDLENRLTTLRLQEMQYLRLQEMILLQSAATVFIPPPFLFLRQKTNCCTLSIKRKTDKALPQCKPSPFSLEKNLKNRYHFPT